MTTKPSIFLIEARFYTDINDELLKGATRAIDEAGYECEHIVVPGALEVPVLLGMAIKAKLIGARQTHQGVVALGCVIRGETAHYDIVANESAHGLMQLCMEHAIPFGNGILTVETGQQARVRADHMGKNKGGDAVQACLALIEHRRDFFDRDKVTILEGQD